MTIIGVFFDKVGNVGQRFIRKGQENMVDFHTHILPGIDRGATANAKASVELLEKSLTMGFSDVVLTPRFNANKESLSDFLARRERSARELLSAVNGKAIPELHLGAEVYLCPALFHNRNLKELTVNGEGKFMLVELPDEDFLSVGIVSMLERLAFSRRITPVIAHMEDHPFLMEESSLLELLDMGCTAQMSYTAFNKFFTRRKLKKFIRYGYVSVLGSDVQGTEGYFEEISKSLTHLNVELGEKFVKELNDYTRKTMLCS